MYTDGSMDNWRNEQLYAMMQVSTKVYDFISGEQYLMGNEQPEGITENTILQEAYLLILDELTELGLEPTVDVSELIGDGYRGEALIKIRMLLDKDSLAKTFIRLGQDGIDRLSDVLSQVGDIGEEEDVFMQLVGLLYELVPSEDMELILDHSDLWHSNGLFIEHLHAILDSGLIGQHGSTVLDPKDLAIIQPYMEYKRKHIKDITDATLMLGKFYKVDMVELLNRLNVHDRDLLSPGIISGMAYSWMLSKQSNIEANKVLAEKLEEAHHHNNTHHLEYYKYNWESMELIDMVEVVGDRYSEDMESKDMFILAVEEEIDKVGTVPEEVKSRLLEIANNLNMWDLSEV
jgi:hypothetical protein